MTERQSLGLAFALHAALFAALSVWVVMPSPLPSIAETSVEVVDVADAPSVRSQRRADPAPPPPAPSEAPPEPAAEPAPPPPAAPAPAPAPAPPQPIDDRPAQDAVAEIAAKPTPAKPAKPAPPKAPALDTDRLASLIGQARPRDAKPAQPARSVAPARDSDAFARSVARAIPAGGRIDARTAANLEGAIRAQIAPCWNPPVGGADVATMTAVLRIRLARDGTVAAPPVLVSQTGATAGNAAYARAFADTARRAVLRCAPIKLPPELFDYWREFELNFDPKLMT